MSSHPCRFLAIIRANYNCAQQMRAQATEENTLGSSIICLSVRASVDILQFLYLYSFPAWGSSAAIYLSPNWGMKDPSDVHSSLYLGLPLGLFVSLSGFPNLLLVVICAARNCVQRMQPQATASNSLSGSIIFPYLYPVIRRPFEIFIFVFVYSVGIQCRNEFI